jgi:hypothetical protein
VDVKFSGQVLYCQITRSELDRLLSGRALDLNVALPRNHSFRVSVRPSAMAADRGGWQLDSDPTGIWVTIPRAEIEMLGQTTTFAERLMRDFAVSTKESVQVILEALPDEEKVVGSVLEITPQVE